VGLYSGPFLASVLDRFGFVSAVMEISIYSLLEGAERAIGSMAIIDVFRAFTSAAVALANGAASIVMVRSVEEALALREAEIGQICMGEVRGRAPPGFDFGNSPLRSQESISAARRSPRGPAPVHRASSPQARPTDFTRSRWSPQRRPPAPFFPVHPIRCPWSLWVTMASSEPTKMSYAQSTSGIGAKEGRVIQMLFVASSWQVAKSGAFTILPVLTCTRRTWTSRSTSIATISP
jgi:hypothetical protein